MLNKPVINIMRINFLGFKGVFETIPGMKTEETDLSLLNFIVGNLRKNRENNIKYVLSIDLRT